MSYLDRLKDKIAEKALPDQPPKPPEPSFGGFGGDRPRAISGTQARATLRHWHGRLRALDPYGPPEGFTLNCWVTLVDDAHWLYENFCSQAVRDGWSALDLFGVLPHAVEYGGLVARLRGVRNLKMEGPKAVWSSWGVRDWTCAGAGDGLVASGIVLLWEVAHLG